MFSKPVLLGALIGIAATVTAVVLGAGYFGLGKPRGNERSAAPTEAHAPAPSKPVTIAISGQFKKDLAKHPVFVMGDTPIPLTPDEEDQRSFLAGGTVEIVSLDGDVVASGVIANNGTFTLKIPPAPKYIVRASNNVVSVSYGVITGGLPDMKQAEAPLTDDAKGGEAGHGGKAAH